MDWVVHDKLLSAGSSNLVIFNPSVPCIFVSCIEIKINLNFYFHASLWCLKRFYEGLI